MSIQDFIPSEKIPALMRKHDVYVLASNAYEGWNAVINEAMSVGYAVIGSDKVGAGAALIEHGVNGLLFKSGSVDSLYNCLSDLLDYKIYGKNLGSNAHFTIKYKWGTNIASERFYTLSKSLINSDVIYLEFSGPLSSVMP